MEKLLKPYDKECMKMAMLKHEETFKKQVYELHCLYQTQKTLMKNFESSMPNRRSLEIWDSKNGIGSCQNFSNSNHHRDTEQKQRKKLDLERPAEEYIAGSDGDEMQEIEDESEIELTLGLSSYNPRKKAADTTLTSDSGPSFSSSSTGSSHTRRTSPGTQQRTITAKEELNSSGWGHMQVNDMNPGFQSGRKISIDVEEQLRQERLKQPPWLFQVLGLNMT
ncbi:uncharacterized protein LOC131152621 [Malania oleifera]|uniref:uncharacterized protein LOC131152621 n=1 Tax=Malania oleifera TaxID=397392 RepID=UPI0025AE14F8|nr:uncharacterized protein LOC131152621 [Malania oleifera]XP_057960368.1 uncharacterized protein LOC131152621 [Malania oleifera]XP_057960377.1 uncharacterized protein LOC131152621 [Malania oleifera]XP_057960386.1 uncharacterized protein LOC131152621 [Malania oleifera]